MTRLIAIVILTGGLALALQTALPLVGAGLGLGLAVALPVLAVFGGAGLLLHVRGANEYRQFMGQEAVYTARLRLLARPPYPTPDDAALTVDATAWRVVDERMEY